MVRDFVNLLLRVGVAFALIYPAISGFFNPTAWIGFFPVFIQDLVGGEANQTYLLHAFAVLEIIVGLWILAGKRVFIPSLLAAAILFFIVIFNLPLMDILFRDIPIMLMAIALALMTMPSRSDSPPSA